MLKSLYRPLLLTAIFLTALLPSYAVQDKVNMTLPSTVTYTVTNVLSATTGAPAPSSITYSSGNLHWNAHLRISVMANAAVCTPPGGGPSIPAGSFSWTAANATGGVGYNGTLVYNAYTVVYQSNSWNGNALSGAVNLTWKMAAPPTGVRAGTYTISLTWRVDSV